MRNALAKDGWEITDDPYIVAYGERFLFIDLAAELFSENGEAQGQIFGAERDEQRIAVEIKTFRGKSVIQDLEQAVGQYVIYRLLLNRVDTTRQLYLAVTDVVFDEVFREPIGAMLTQDLPMQLIVINVEDEEVKKWTP